MLHLKASVKLRILDHQAVPDDEMLSALPSEMQLAALEQMLGEPFEQRWGGGHGELHDGRLAARAHDRR